MKVQALIEREDGGADIILEDVSEYEMKALLQAGFVAMVERFAKEEEEKQRIPSLLKGSYESR